MTGKVSGEKVKTTFALGMNVDLSVLSFVFFYLVENCWMSMGCRL